MFTSAVLGGEESTTEQCDPAPSNGLRPLGLKPIQGGGLVLPAFHPSVPTTLQLNAVVEPGIARLCLAAHKQGLHLPAGPFLSPIETLRAQIAGLYTTKATALLGHELPMQVNVVGNDDGVKLIGVPESRLPTFVLKPVVEDLNAKVPGLGWWVCSLIAQAHALGATTYDPTRIRDCVTYSSFCGADDDAEFAFTMYEGRDDLSEDDTEDMDALVARMRSEYDFYPSMLNQILGIDEQKKRIQPQQALRSAQSLLEDKQRLSPVSRAVLKALPELHRAIARARRRKVHIGPSDDEYEAIGALGFVLWEPNEGIYELIYHYESSALEGDAVEELFCISTSLSQPENWKSFFIAIETFFDVYVALTNLLLPMEVNA